MIISIVFNMVYEQAPKIWNLSDFLNADILKIS